jgi:hypothetical protein
MNIITWKINEKAKYITWIVRETCSSEHITGSEYSDTRYLICIDNDSLYDLFWWYKWSKVSISYIISDTPLDNLTEEQLVLLDIKKQLWFIEDKEVSVDIFGYSTISVMDITFDWLYIYVWWHNISSEISCYLANKSDNLKINCKAICYFKILS